MTHETRMPARLSIGQRLALGAAILMTVILAAYGAIGSYTTISDTAAHLGVPFPSLVPIGIDGGLVGVIVLDLVLAWSGHPLAWLRQLARLLTIGTVTANISAGWPHPISIGLHAAAPLMLLAMVEAGRAVLLRRTGLATGIARDHIPFGRWILSPWRTWLLWRRMILWQITNYHDALHAEAQIRRARTLLHIHYGRAWKRKAPADLVWMLGIAPFAHEACTRVTTLTATPNAEPERTTTNDAHDLETNRRIRTDDPPSPNPRMAIPAADDQLEEVIRINEHHWATRNRPVSADTVREHLAIGAARARELTRTVRAMDRTTIQRHQRPHPPNGHRQEHATASP